MCGANRLYAKKKNRRSKSGSTQKRKNRRSNSGSTQKRKVGGKSRKRKVRGAIRAQHMKEIKGAERLRLNAKRGNTGGAVQALRETEAGGAV